MEQPMISVIMPVYNTGKYLNESLSSVFAQTYRDFELICVDDGSDDELTLQILQSYESRYSNMRILRMERNVGAGEARNRGLWEAAGRYVMFLDADDLFSEEMLARLHAQIVETGADVVVCGYGAFCMRNGQEIKLFEWTPDAAKLEDGQAETYFLHWPMSPWNKMYNRDFLIQHRICFQTLSSCNDVFFSIMVAKTAKKKTYLADMILVKCRKNIQTQISANRRSDNLVYAIDLAERTMEKNGCCDETARRQLMIYLIVDGIRELDRCKDEETNRQCYKFIQERLKKDKIAIDDRQINNFYLSFLEKSYESRWHTMESVFYEQLKDRSEELLAQLSDRRKIYLWGLGNRGKAFQRFCAETGVMICGAVDRKNADIGGKTAYGNKICHTDQALKEAELIIASNSDIYNDVRQNKEFMQIINLETYCSV